MLQVTQHVIDVTSHTTCYRCYKSHN